MWGAHGVKPNIIVMRHHENLLGFVESKKWLLVVMVYYQSISVMCLCIVSVSDCSLSMSGVT